MGSIILFSCENTAIFVGLIDHDTYILSTTET